MAPIDHRVKKLQADTTALNGAVSDLAAELRRLNEDQTDRDDPPQQSVPQSAPHKPRSPAVRKGADNSETLVFVWPEPCRRQIPDNCYYVSYRSSSETPLMGFLVCRSVVHESRASKGT